MKKVIIKGLYAVGMHHHGQRALQVAAQYCGKPEPENSFDRHAIALHAHPSDRLCAFLRRQDALFISELHRLNLIDGHILIKPKFKPVFRARLGPSQRCNLGFYAKDEHVASIQICARNHGMLVRFAD